MNETAKNKDEFVWTDELVAEFTSWSLIKSPTMQGRYADIEQFKVSKKHKPLFVTEDGKEIFEGDDFWTVNPYESNFYVQKWNCDTTEAGKAIWLKYFSTEAAARKYVRLNKPMYSLNEIEKAWNTNHICSLSELINNLEKLKP